MTQRNSIIYRLCISYYAWMASLTQWTWVWAKSRSWWWTGKPQFSSVQSLSHVRLFATQSSPRLTSIESVMPSSHRWQAVIHGVTKSDTTELLNWTEVKRKTFLSFRETFVSLRTKYFRYSCAFCPPWTTMSFISMGSGLSDLGHSKKCPVPKMSLLSLKIHLSPSTIISRPIFKKPLG